MQVRLFARPEESVTEWTCFADVTCLLGEHLKSAEWAVITPINEMKAEFSSSKTAHCLISP